MSTQLCRRLCLETLSPYTRHLKQKNDVESKLPGKNNANHPPRVVPGQFALQLAEISFFSRLPAAVVVLHLEVVFHEKGGVFHAQPAGIPT